MAFEFEPSNPFSLAASPSTSSEPAQQAPDVQAQQNQQAMPEQKPFGWTDWAKKSAMKNGDYYEHDNKVYYQRDGKTYLLTGDGMGDVELDEGQAGQLAKEREERAATKKQQEADHAKLDYTNDGSLGMDARGDISESVIGAAQGFVMKPKGGDPYEGLNRYQQFGRFLGALVPGWDSSAEAGDALNTIGDKLEAGRPVTSSDAWNVIEKEIKLGTDLAPIGVARKLR